MKFHRNGSLPTDDSIFVFGSNLIGRHGRGAAHVALCGYGAIYGMGVGPQGQSYAIPTKDWAIQRMKLDVIKLYVDQFIQYANLQKSKDNWIKDATRNKLNDTKFFITAIGCGLAGYKPEQIAPMFKAAPNNCSFPDIWKPYLE
jgi:hypothetical protein